MDKRKIILDVDTGGDDAIAIMMAVLSSRLDLRAVTVTHGNLPLENTLDNTLRVVQFLGADVPVYAGCPEAMAQWLRPGRCMNPMRQPQFGPDGRISSIHEAHLPLPEPKIWPQEQHAVSFLVDTLRKEKLTLVVVGPATNIAMALRMDPSIARNIEEFVVMGGGVNRSNATQSAEFNFYMDPEAAEIMLRAGVKTTIFPLNATQSVLFNEQDGEDFRAVGTPVAEYIGKHILFGCENVKKINLTAGDDDSFDIALHDVLCVLYLLDPAIVLEMKHQNAYVDFSGGYADGALLVENRSYMDLTDDTYVTYRADKARVKDLMIRILRSGG